MLRPVVEFLALVARKGGARPKIRLHREPQGIAASGPEWIQCRNQNEPHAIGTLSPWWSGLPDILQVFRTCLCEAKYQAEFDFLDLIQSCPRVSLN